MTQAMPPLRGRRKQEFSLDKPVIAINTATSWCALRQNGIEDKLQGFGKLLAEY
jgi:maleate isomerase